MKKSLYKYFQQELKKSQQAVNQLTKKQKTVSKGLLYLTAILIGIGSNLLSGQNWIGGIPVSLAGVVTLLFSWYFDWVDSG